VGSVFQRYQRRTFEGLLCGGEAPPLPGLLPARVTHDSQSTHEGFFSLHPLQAWLSLPDVHFVEDVDVLSIQLQAGPSGPITTLRARFEYFSGQWAVASSNWSGTGQERQNLSSSPVEVKFGRPLHVTLTVDHPTEDTITCTLYRDGFLAARVRGIPSTPQAYGAVKVRSRSPSLISD
jgi:hypothetical protein